MKLFENLPSQNTPITAEMLNQIKDNLVVVSPTEPIGDNREKVWMQKGKNLFNKNDIAKGYGFLATGELTTNSNLFVSTEYLPVNSSVEYTLGNSSSIDRLVICEYDSSKTFIKRNIILNSSTLTITTTSTTKYIKLNSVISALDTLQLEQGSTATSYEAYIEPKMYVKNDNDVYEEFYKEQKEAVIFEGEVGDIDATIELNNSSQNYRALIIEGKDGGGYFGSVRIDNANGKKGNLKSITLNKDGSYYSEMHFSISDKIITINTNYTAVNRATEYSRYASNNMKITKVIGIA